MYCLFIALFGLCIGAVGLSIAIKGGVRDIYTYLCLWGAAMMYLLALCLTLFVMTISLFRRTQ